jgi:uroporphyrin-III C-methyltransferase / precorrin-2 dehydrogenase / sirohydrochlorin ferrochelatase
MRVSRRPAATEPQRIAPLAKLPLFHDLKGKRVVVAGDSDGARWKAELLAAAGARVETVHLPVTPQDLAGAALAVAEAENDAEAQAFVDAAHAAGVLANVIDKPAFCDFQFGSIVNRSPLVIGISTDGAAPVFGQAIRARIEAMLPASFSQWAETAVAWRQRLAVLNLPFALRRRFWERFASLAFSRPGTPPTDSERDTLIAEAASIKTEPPRGRITLVGAGPGDAELLTLKAVRALQSADVILYDDLVSVEVLDFARREAKRMLVGKTGHGPSCKQEDINALMLGLAGQGKHVVRLKSGDPGIFGRAGEEITAARAAGIPVAIVPGISAAQGAAAALGFSLTHRDHARRLQFVTGHARNGQLPDDIDWVAMANPSVTTALYMPKATLAAFGVQAMAAGLPSATPALAITNATRPDQAVIMADIATLAEALRDHVLQGPALVLIGNALKECDATVLAAAASPLLKAAA